MNSTPNSDFPGAEPSPSGSHTEGDCEGSRPVRAEACPEPGEWLRLALAQTDEAESSALLAHAARCRQCAGRLRLSLQVQSADMTPEEAAEAESLPSSSISWQQHVAARLARTPREPLHRPLPRVILRSGTWLWAGMAVAASVLIAVGLYLAWQRANSPERMLAEVYGQTRVFVLRMPGAAFSPVHPGTHLRGGASSREPEELHEALATIEHKLKSAPQDPHWLELEARSNLLEEDFDSAIDTLDRLVASGPVTAALLADDAAAYFQRGASNNSETDRATALDYLSRADQLAPSDPVILFNEAVVMEDRGQLIGAAGTWRRYLRVERDPAWLAEGRERLANLEQRLERLRSHATRMEQHLATPRAMRALAAEDSTLAQVDEEFSSSLLPKLLSTAFPLPSDGSRGSPCDDSCEASRTLLSALAASLERNHRDPWLSRFLPSGSGPLSTKFPQAADALGRAIDAYGFADYPTAASLAAQAIVLFHSLGNRAGENRARLESSVALQRLARLEDCHRSARSVLAGDKEFAWIQIEAAIEDGICDTGPGTASSKSDLYQRILADARAHGYAILELRAWTTTAGSAMESGDAEETWRIDLAGIRSFYAGDYPAFRLVNLVAGLAEVEGNTPRVQLSVLIRQEYLAAMEMTENRNMIPYSHMYLAVSAIRAGETALAEEQIRRAQSYQASLAGVAPFQQALAASEIDLASLDIRSGDLRKAEELLDAAHPRLAGNDNFVKLREYVAARSQLELALGHPDAAESMLRERILDEERQALDVGQGNVLFAKQNRDLYAILAGLWLEQRRPAEEVLALWERYRLRILGQPVPLCSERRLDCLKPELVASLARLGQDLLMGQIVLSDRVLLYRAGSDGVTFESLPFSSPDVLAAATSLERAVTSPDTSRQSVDQAAMRIGDLFFPKAQVMPQGAAQLLLESDPLLGNLPWPAVEIGSQPAGLHFNLEETPSLLLKPESSANLPTPFAGLIVGASVASGASGELPALPEALDEAREVARFVHDPHVLLAGEATEPQVASAMASAATIHFAGHAVRRLGGTRLLLATRPGSSEESWLDSDFFRKHPPRVARLVVFSACSTGKREMGWDHDMGDIVDTLSSLGVPEVVATRWQIDSAAAVPMMDAFYGALSQGLSVSESLTRARSSLSRDSRYRHPFYWAAFYASGTGATDLREAIHGGKRQSSN